MAYRETSPLDGVRAFLDDGLQLWEPYDALQCCELGPTALQVTPSELVQDGQLPQILFSQSQKEVVPRRESLQIPQPQTFHIPSVPFVQKKFRKLAWAIMSISLLVILIIVLVVVLLKLRRSRVANSTDPSVGPLSPTGLSNASSIFQLPATDVMVDSPLGLVYSKNSAQQGYRVYYQSVSAEIKEIQSNEGSPLVWFPAKTIFTDAINNTGLAVYSYMNGSNPQTSIFYVRSDGYIQEKRNYFDLTTWEPGINSINNVPLKADSIPGNDQDGSENIWKSYRMAAIYSQNILGQPQGRLYYHGLVGNGSAVVQEMIWIPNNDSWVHGDTLTDPWPNSHLAVTINSVTKTLHLLYSAGNLTLQESWLNISEAGAIWQTGIKLPNILTHDDTSLAAVSIGDRTWVYFYAISIGGMISIRELNLTAIPGTPASWKNGITINAKSLPVVAQPQFITSGVPSLYQPIGATVSTLINSEAQIYVFWAEQNVSSESGYGALKTVSRYVDAAWGSSDAGSEKGQVTLPIKGP